MTLLPSFLLSVFFINLCIASPAATGQRALIVLISQDANSIGNDVEYKMMIGLSQRWVCKPNGRSQQGRIGHRTYPSARKCSLYLGGIDLETIKTI